MTKQQYFTIIEKQIQQLNDRIDAKIMHGLSYAAESKKHKELLRQLRLHKKAPIGFGRLFGAVFQY